ncbi:hypothetical protein BG004_000921 [Podila humilis]|nr:hypothetical protein BG004_000921 [Podila humilis]
MYLPTEVLEEVCLHLSRIALRHSASLVCRRWFLVCRRLLHNVGHWKLMGDGEQGELVSKIRSFQLDTLHCWLLMDYELPLELGPVITSEQHRVAWRTFMRAMIMPNCHTDGVKSTGLARTGSLECAMYNIRQFAFHGYRMTFSKVIDPLLPYLSRIRSLVLDYRDPGRSVDLFRILDMCLFLEDITIQGPHLSHVAIDDESIGKENSGQRDPFMSTEEIARALDSAFEYYSPEDYIVDSQRRTSAVKARISTHFNQRYRLCSLVVARANIPLAVLERVIVACTDLRVLKLRSINKDGWLGIEDIDDSDQTMTCLEDIMRGQIMELARDCCPKLEWLHLMRQSSEERDTSNLERLNDVFIQPLSSLADLSLPSSNPTISSAATSDITPPCVQQVTMLCSHMPSRWTLKVQMLFDQITALEIFPNPMNPFDSSCLNNILCQMPNLLHLHGSSASFSVTELWFPPPASTTNVYNGTVIPSAHSQAIQASQMSGNSGKRLARYFKRRDRDEKKFAQRNAALQTALLPVPRTWQCRQLRTLDIGLSSSVTSIDITTLYRYLVLHCPHIQNLVLTGVPDLYVGQRLPVKSDATAGRTNRVSIKAPLQLQILQELKELVSIDISVRMIPGFVESRDFRFLRKQALASTNAWPQLESLTIRYAEAPLVMSSLSSVVNELREVRPAVVIRFRHDLHQLL